MLNGGRLPPLVFEGACFPADPSTSRCIGTNLHTKVVKIICYISLAIWSIEKHWRWARYILSGAVFGLFGLCMAYAMLFLSESSHANANAYTQLGSRELYQW